MTEELVQDFFSKFPVHFGKSEHPYIILFDAYSGMGKSTVSRKLAEYLDVVILNNDEVRRFIDDLHDKTDLKNRLQAMRLERLYKNHNNCVWDGSFSHNYKEKLEYIKSLGFRYYVIRLKCDEAIIKMRMDARTLDGVNFSLAPYSNYLWMKENIPLVPDEMVDFVIHTDDDIEKQVKEFVDYINKTK